MAAVAALCAGASVAGAQDHGGAERLDRLFEQIDLDASGTLTVGEMRAAAAARFNALDLDGDGTVMPGERQTSRDNRLSIRFHRADRDGDGLLDAAEMAEVAKQRARRRLASLDTDGDGMLSLEELQRARPPAPPEQAHGTTPLTLPQLDARMMAIFRRADADGDGIVTRREAADGAGR